MTSYVLQKLFVIDTPHQQDLDKAGLIQIENQTNIIVNYFGITFHNKINPKIWGFYNNKK